MPMNTNANSKFICNFCSTEYSDKKSLRSHIQTCKLSDDENEEKKVCPLCKKQVDDLYEHLQTCGNESMQNSSQPTKANRKYGKSKKCPMCSEMFDEAEYDDHVDDCGIKSSSTTKKKKKCQACSLEMNENEYTDHISQCGGDSGQKSFAKKTSKICQTCLNSFDEKEYPDHVAECTNEPQVIRSKTKKHQTHERMSSEGESPDYTQQYQSRSPSKPSKSKVCQTCKQEIPESEFIDHVEQCEDARARSRPAIKKDTSGECPICFKQFPINDLPEHANRCSGSSSNSNSRPSATRATSMTCFTCNASVTTSKSSSCAIPCRSKHTYCIKCLEQSMNQHINEGTPPVCKSNLCDYQLCRYDVYCLPLNKQLIDRLLPLIKSTQRPKCPLCSFYVEMKTMDDFHRHANSCFEVSIPCGYCNCLINANEYNGHEAQCRQGQHSERQQAYYNFMLSRTKYPMTIHELRVFLDERKKDRQSTDAHDIVDALAEFDGVFPFEIPKRDCDVCAESFVYDDIFVFGCNESHKLCYGCFAESTANKIKENQILTCAMCTYQLQDGEIKQLRIPAEEKRKYINYQTEKTFSNFAGGQGILRCPNKSCKWVAELTDPNDRFQVKCGACAHQFCSLCSQQYHYRTTCQQLPDLTQRWFFWCNAERGNYWQARAQQDATYRAQLEDHQRQRQTNEQRNQELSQRYNELLADEQFKAQNCRLCPHCGRVVQHLEGCDSMVCGRNYHGGDQQSGCGHAFKWSQAARYAPMANTGPRQVANDIAAPEQQKLVVHEGVQCDACHNVVQGIRFDCVHCPSLIFCEKCEQRATLEHSNRIRAENKPPHNIFQVMATPENANTRR